MTEKDNNSNPTFSSTSIQPLCPFSLQTLPIQSNLRNVALIFESLYPTKSHVFSDSNTTNYISETSKDPCQCTLIPLIHYLYDSSVNISKSSQFLCPVCQSHSVASIFDYKAFQLLQREFAVTKISKPIHSIDDDASLWSVVAFRYGKQYYYLSVNEDYNDTNETNAKNDSNFAQDWIAHILGMEVELTMKILHKGKIIHPNPNQSPYSISQSLLQISKTDIHAYKKPSLVVIGTRMNENIHSNSFHSNENLENQNRTPITLRKFIPHNLISLLYQWGKNVIVGIIWFVKSMIIVPTPND